MANKIVREIIHAKGIDIGIYTKDFENEYISLTDIAKYRNDNDPRFVIQNWMRNRNTVEFLAVWEELHNPDFNRVQFEAVRSEAGLNRFVMTPTKWIEQTNAIGIVSKAGRYGGGTYAHSDIAMAFATWISPEKARKGKWNGGFAPYGYALIDGKLVVNEEEAVVIRTIFDQYVNTDLGANGIAKYLENHGIHKIARQNGKNPLFDAALIRRIIQNPVYSGKISYGRRRTEKVHGTRNEYRQVKKDDYLLVDGLHEALVSEEVWEQAQVKVAAQAKKYEKVNRDKKEKIHLLSGILKCPVCGAGMYGNKAIKKRKDGSHYKDFYYYGCKHRNMTRGHKCGYKKQVHEEMLDASVAEVISKLVSNPKFSDLIRSKINMEVDTSALDQEIANYEKQLRQLYHNKDTILSDIDSLDYEDKHYQRRKTDLENRLYKTYDKIDEAEELLISAKTKKRALLADKITGDNIYKALIFFDKLYAKMNEAEKREFLSQLVDNVQIYEERKENGQWLKSIEFKLPIIEKEFTLGLDNNTQNETVCLLSRKAQ